MIINRYDVTATGESPAATDQFIKASVITGGVEVSGANDGINTIVNDATYTEQVISKLVGIKIIGTDILIDARDNTFIRVDLIKLGISGVRSVLAASLLGVYDAEATGTGLNIQPSFMGIWDKTTDNVTALYIINSQLILRIPSAQTSLFLGKTAMIQLFYQSANGQ